jgi:Spy/CpxP family protein refolding chaperone
MDRVKTTLQTIAAKEADLRLTHLAAMQDIQNLLTPEQQKLFRSLRGHMMDGGGKMSRGGLQHGKSGH